MLTAARFGTRDIDRAKKFYDAVTKPLGASRVMEHPGVVGYKAADGAMLMLGTPFAGDATSGNGTMVSLTAPSRAVVDEIHATALKMGGKCEGPPGVRGPESSDFYGAYFRDPDGNKLAVFRVGTP